MKISDKRMLLLIIRAAIFEIDALSETEKKELKSIQNWAKVIEELKAQNLFCLLYPIIDEIDISDCNIFDSYKKQCLQMYARWYQVLYAQNELISLLNKDGIPSVIIKGNAIGIYYNNPLFRNAGDIDILVSRKDFDKAADILIHQNYKLISDTSHTIHHNAYIKSGIDIELHRWLGGIKATDEHSIELFEKNIEKRQYRQIDKFLFPVLPDPINGLVILLHINQHLREGIGLRHIVDWMMFVDKYLTDDVWESSISMLLKNMGIEKLAITVTAMCVKYLGLKKDIHWYRSADMKTCDELMEYVLEKGNFGCKKDDEDKIASFWITVHDPISFFRRLQKYGMYRWEKAQKKKILKPFAWAYQLLYIVKTLKQQKRSFTEMRILYKEGKKQGDLINKLGLDR